MPIEIVITFPNALSAIQAENVLLRTDFLVRVMPLPSTIRAGCGICLRVSDSDAQAALATLKKEGIPFGNLFNREILSGKSVYTPWKEGCNEY